MALKYFYAAVFITALVIVREAYGLDCYSCEPSVTSKEDCKSKMTQKTCPSYSSVCVDGVLTCTADDVTKSVYYLGCGKKGDDCGMDKYPSCPTSSASWSSSISESCCSGNLCNSGTVSTASALVLSMCFALALLVSTVVY